MVEFWFSEKYFSTSSTVSSVTTVYELRALSIISTILKSAILYKIVNNPIEKMHLSEIQLGKFMRQNMNMNKTFFYTFTECFH